jgi:hypothetical protein
MNLSKTFQMCSAYYLIERSDEKQPERAAFIIDIRGHSPRLLSSAATFS